VKVNYNRVIFPYTKLNDTGAIYFIGDFGTPAKNILAQSDFSEVRGNYLVERAPAEQAQLIYTDEGSCFIHFVNNVVDGKSGLHTVLSRLKNCRGKTFCNGFLADYEDFVPTKWDPDCYAANNVQLHRSKQHPLDVKDWPVEAQAIIEKAGLEPAYRDLLKTVEKAR
jgi:hypothetical protein